MSIVRPHPDTSSTDRPHSTSGVKLPIDIFFCVVDAAIASAEHDASVNREKWRLDYHGQLSGNPQYSLHSLWSELPSNLSSMRLRRLRRFNLLRSVSQVNSGARKMVQRHFTRIETPGTMNEPQGQDDFAWVCPKLDTFVLRLASCFQGPSPRVKDLTLIRSVEIAAVSGVWRLLSGVPPQVPRLLGFPNLRVVTTREVGSRRTRSALSSIGKILPVDVNLFPELRMWLAHGHTLDELCQKWKPFWDRGVRVMINDDPGPDGRHFAVEFLGTPAGLRMRFVDDAY